MAIKAKKVQPAKVEAIAAAKAVLETGSDYIFADYRGLTVEQISALRKQFRSGCTMDASIYAAAPQKGTSRCIDDGIYVHFGNIIANNNQWHFPTSLFSGSLSYQANI